MSARVGTLCAALLVMISACADDGSTPEEEEPGTGARDAAVAPRDAAAAARDATSPARDARVNAEDAAVAAASENDASAAADAGVHADAGPRSDGGLSYESFGKKFMESYCTSCHNARVMDPEVMPVFEDLAQIRRWKTEIEAEAVSSTRMPNASKRPTSAERKQLGQWLDALN